MKNKTVTNKHSRKMQKKSDRQLLTLCLPTTIKLFIFSYIPMIGIYMAFVNYIPRKGIFKSKFVGFDNFKYLFQSVDFKRIFTNTVVYNLLFIFTGLVFSVILALLIFEIHSRKALKVYQTSFFLPFFISWVLVSFILQALIDNDGIITMLIKNISGRTIYFYKDAKYWRFILPIVNIWKGAGVSAIIYYATLMNCDPSLYESAELDGANRLQKMIYISLPYLRTMICVNVIMSGANILRSDLGLFFFATKDIATLYEATDVIDTYIWRIIRKAGEFKIGTAVGFVQGLIGLVLTIFANRIVRRIDEQSALY